MLIKKHKKHLKKVEPHLSSGSKCLKENPFPFNTPQCSHIPTHLSRKCDAFDGFFGCIVLSSATQDSHYHKDRAKDEAWNGCSWMCWTCFFHRPFTSSHGFFGSLFPTLTFISHCYHPGRGVDPPKFCVLMLGSYDGTQEIFVFLEVHQET